MNDAELIEKVNILLDAQAAADKFSGSVLIARENQVILHRSAWLRNSSQHTG